MSARKSAELELLYALQRLCTAGQSGIAPRDLRLSQHPEVVLESLVASGLAVHDEKLQSYFITSDGRNVDAEQRGRR